MFKKKLGPPEGKEKEKYLLLFIISFVGMMIGFLPSIIHNNGIFMYYGDFNSQQLMFYQHAQQMVKEGNFGWDWGTDLGSGFVGTYSFYLLGSPFFWLTCLFPEGTAVYMLPWLLAIKTGVGAMCAYAYLRRFISNKNCAAIGGLLYAFSGFQTYNIFFNHFHDATAFFPLLLLAFELLVQENKKGAFAIAVAITATISYFFFVSAVVFTVIYFFLRCLDKDFDITIKKFVFLGIEAVIGVAISCIILLPSVLMVMNNYRVNERMIGLDYILYTDKARIARIFQAFFTLSDMPARVNIFDVDSARWASLAGYLPLFSMCGVIAYVRTHSKKDWLGWSVFVFTVMACVPFLNSAFTLFNASYYARWYYHPILLFALMTAKVLEEDHTQLKKGFMPTAIAGIGFLAVGLLPKYEGQEIVYGKLAQYPPLYYIQIGVTVTMIFALAALIYFIAHKKVDFHKTALIMTAVACVICTAPEVWYGVTQGSDNDDYIDRAIHGKEKIDVPRLDAAFSYGGEDSDFYRIDVSDSIDNWVMFWDLPTMRCFHSCVDPSIMDYYSELGQTRDVASRIEPEYYPFRAINSVRYYFDELPESQRKGEAENPKSETLTKLKGFTYIDTMNGFNVYENKNYIPMGYAYDYYTTDAVIKDAEELERSMMLTKAMVIDDNQAATYSDYLSYCDFSEDDLDYDEYAANCAERKADSCYYFRHDTNSFTGKIKLDRPKMVYFSVPYEKGWSATVNGVETKVEKVNYGMMALPVPAGDSEIVFTYSAEGQTKGIALTIFGVVAFAAYMVYAKFFDKETAAVKSSSKKSEEAERSEDTED
ncbi:YfhO family protein [Ruminococcus sp.]|uniref:YfhO family protein n=1 Tax=Ruminococcus sp. TaxID=41978 RepID=UPI0025EB38FE|nr:YfhO family protein [Ruminococcus sp.]MBQ8966449.1 YfhO family protein [Ruminococcus sp.]